jgi:hypothetical protein
MLHNPQCLCMTPKAKYACLRRVPHRSIAGVMDRCSASTSAEYTALTTGLSFVTDQKVVIEDQQTNIIRGSLQYPKRPTMYSSHFLWNAGTILPPVWICWNQSLSHDGFQDFGKNSLQQIITERGLTVARSVQSIRIL